MVDFFFISYITIVHVSTVWFVLFLNLPALRSGSIVTRCTFASKLDLVVVDLRCITAGIDYDIVKDNFLYRFYKTSSRRTPSLWEYASRPPPSRDAHR